VNRDSLRPSDRPQNQKLLTDACKFDVFAWDWLRVDVFVLAWHFDVNRVIVKVIVVKLTEILAEQADVHRSIAQLYAEQLLSNLLHLAHKIVLSVSSSLQLCEDRAPRLCELSVVAAETRLVSANVVDRKLEERLKVVSLCASLPYFILNKLKPAQETMLWVNQTLERLSPHRQILKLFVKVLLGPQEQLGRLLGSTAHVYLEIGLNHFEGVIQCLRVLSLDLPDFLGNYVGLGSVHKRNNLVDPPQENPRWCLARRLHELRINLVRVALLHQVQKARNLIPCFQATEVNRLKSVLDCLQSQHVHRLADVLGTLADHSLQSRVFSLPQNFEVYFGEVVKNLGPIALALGSVCNFDQEGLQLRMGRKDLLYVAKILLVILFYPIFVLSRKHDVLVQNIDELFMQVLLAR
jgi:hypothetical protein